jgi:hypothetical protein
MPARPEIAPEARGCLIFEFRHEGATAMEELYRQPR